MNIEQECILSFYEELTDLDSKGNVKLVKHVESGELFVKKRRTLYNRRVYEILRGLTLPGIPKVYECFEDEEKLYIIEEYVHGQNLYRVREEKGNLSEREVRDYMGQIARILQGLHGLEDPLIHRDIKPSNLMLTKEGKIVLIDFNAARLQAEGKKQDTVLMGTKYFAAPEQYGFGSSDIRTDLYGLGASMNYLLTGRSIHECRTEGRLGRIIDKCTAIDAKDRYQSAEELERALSLKKSLRLPGFRTCVMWKRILALFFYVIYALFCYRIKIYDNEVLVTGLRLYWERSTLFLAGIMVIFLCFNYLGIQEKLPGLSKTTGVKKGIPRIILLSLYGIGIVFVTLFIMILIENLL